MSTTPRQAPPLFSPAPAPRGRNLTALSLLALAAICAIALALQILSLLAVHRRRRLHFAALQPAIAGRARADLERSASRGGGIHQPAVGADLRRTWRAGYEPGDGGTSARHRVHGGRHRGGCRAGVSRLSGEDPVSLGADRVPCFVAERASGCVVAGRTGAAAAGSASGWAAYFGIRWVSDGRRAIRAMPM